MMADVSLVREAIARCINLADILINILWDILEVKFIVYMETLYGSVVRRVVNKLG